MNGILLIDKPILYTSHDVVDVVRRKLSLRRVGHAGTLDPMATGLLVVLVGTATSLFEALSSQDKCYEGVMTLGMEARTQDTEGEIFRTADTSGIREEGVRKVFEQYTGIYQQRTPHYSSAKIQGRKGYQLARKNINFEPPLKTVEVRELTLKAFADPDVYFLAHVSKGTYLRALANDVGQALGVGALLSALRRTRSGRYAIQDSLTLERFKGMSLEKIKDHTTVQLDKFYQDKERQTAAVERPSR